MKNKKILKRIIATYIIVTMVGVAPIHLITNVKAKNKEEINLKKYLESEALVHRTRLKSKVEEELNRLGVFDDEIDSLDENIINDIEKGVPYKVYIDYCQEVSEGEDIVTKKMSVKDVDNMINEQCKNPENKKFEFCEKENKKHNIFEKIISRINIGSTEVKAEADVDYTNSGKCKRVLIVLKKNAKKVNVSVVYNWIETPGYRLTDYVNVYLKNASPDKKTGKAYYSYDTWVMVNGKKKYNSFRTDYSYKKMSISDKSMAFKVNLKDDGYLMESYNHKLGLSYTASIDDTINWDYIIATGQYLHQKATIAISPSITFSDSGIFGFSPSVQKKLVALTNPPQVKFYFK